MPRDGIPTVPAVILRLLERHLSSRRYHDVAGDLQEGWTRDRHLSRWRAWRRLISVSSSVLWQGAVEARRRPRAAKGSPMFSGCLQDLRFASRLAARQPWLSAAAVLTMALGIAATTAIFSVMHAWILRPLPYRDPQQLVAVWETIPSASIFENTPALATLTMWKDRARSFDGLTAFTSGVVTLTGAGEPARLNAARVLPDLLPLLGASPAIGRNILPHEADPNGPPVALLTHQTWMTRFGGRASVIGDTLQLSGAPTTIIGVLPADLRIVPFTADIWVPLRMTAADGANTNRILWVIGRLRPGVTPELAGQDVDALMRESTEGQLGARVVPLHEQTIGPLGHDVLVLFAATTIVLLIACANVASLTLARVSARRQEILVRTALGAARGRIVRQILTESLALGLAAAAAGWLLAAWAVRALTAMAPQAARMPEVSIGSPAVFLFALGAAVLTSLLFGITPAVRSAPRHIGAALREGAASVAGGGRGRLLRVIVAAEVTLALALLASAGLIVRSYQQVTSVDLGFSPADVVAFQLPRPAQEPPGTSLTFYQDLLRRLDDEPAVRAAGLIQALPLRSSAMGSGFRIEGRQDDGGSILSYWRVISHDYFEALSIPIVAGRAFDARDHDSAEKTAIVSAAFARRAWPEGSAIGRRIGWGTLEIPLTVVGVAGDIRLSPASSPGPHVYLPFEQVPERPPTELVVRSSAGTAATIDLVRRLVWTIDAAQPVAGVAAMDVLLDRTLRGRRFQLTIFTVAALLALILALVGIYGVLSYATGLMASELGIRTALGAGRSEVIWQVMRVGLTPVAIGVAGGAVLAWMVAGAMRSFLFAVDARDPLTFGIAALLLGATAAIACLIPAWRAARRDPLIGLRGH